MPYLRLKNPGRQFDSGDDLPVVTNTPSVVTVDQHNAIATAISEWNALDNKPVLILETVDPDAAGFVSGEQVAGDGVLEYRINGDLIIRAEGEEGTVIKVLIVQDDVGGHTVTVPAVIDQPNVFFDPNDRSYFEIVHWQSGWFIVNNHDVTSGAPIPEAAGGVSLDTDDMPFFDPSEPEFAVFYDTDDIPYYDVGEGGVPITQDVDSIPYLTLGP